MRYVCVRQAGGTVRIDHRPTGVHNVCSALCTHRASTSTAGITLLAMQRRAERLRHVHRALSTLRTLHDSDFQLRQLVQVVTRVQVLCMGTRAHSEW
jgi:hypothetical protein